jgi:hypothetical protein
MMRRESNNVIAPAIRALALMTGAMLIATGANAQVTGAGESPWRIGASMGAYVPLSSLIIAGDADDTQLEAGPAFSLDAQYLARSSISVYASGILSFGTIRLGSSIRPAIVGPSNQVMLTTATAGLLLTAANWFGDNLQPTLRLGGGFKWYSFDVTDSENQLRPTGDIGVGFRGIGIGSIEVSAEVRYMLSSFDQAKLPIRGIAAQDQRQNDLVFAIGFGIRP